MLPIHRKIILSLKSAHIYRFGNAQRFVNAMHEKVMEEPEYELSQRQEAFLYDLLHHYRRQMPELHRKHCRSEACQLEMERQELIRLELSKQLTLF